jgi:preprotein translocase subunit YajC
VKDLAGLLPFVLIALVFYFLIMRPQRRRQQTLAATQSSLVPGAEVMLTSGIFGRVVSLEDETVHLEMSPGTVVKVSRQAVVRVVSEDRPGLESDRQTDPEEERGPTDPHQ